MIKLKYNGRQEIPADLIGTHPMYADMRLFTIMDIGNRKDLEQFRLSTRTVWGLKELGIIKGNYPLTTLSQSAILMVK